MTQVHHPDLSIDQQHTLLTAARSSPAARPSPTVRPIRDSIEQHVRTLLPDLDVRARADRRGPQRRIPQTDLVADRPTNLFA